MKTSLKQILTLTLATVFAFTLTHCSDNNGGGSDNVGGVDCDELLKLGGHCDPDFTGSPGMDDTTIRDTAWYKELGQCRGHVIDAHTRKGIPGASVEFFTGYVVSSPEPSMVGVTKTDPKDKKVPPIVKKAVPFTDPFADPTKPKDSPPLDPTKGFPVPTKTTPDKKMVVSTITSNDDPATFTNEAGLFAQKDLPSESNIKYIVIAPGYAVEQGYCDTPSPGTETIHGRDLGDIGLALPVDITVVATSKGENVVNCTVHAERKDDAFQFEIAGMTDSSGSVTLKGLNSVEFYDLIIDPCDFTGDGKPDAAKKVVKYDPVKSPKTINISLDDATDEQKLYVTNVNGIIVAGDGLHYPKDKPVEVDEDAIRPGASVLNLTDSVAANQETMSDIFAITKTSPITIDFSWPVALVGSKYHLSYQDELSIDLEDDDDGDYNKVKYVNLTCSLSASNTRVSCQPEAELRINESYKIYGKVKINIPGKTEDDIKDENFDLSDLNENGGTDFWYVTDDSESNIGVIAKNEKPITLDNYDGIGDEGDGADAAGGVMVWMEFPEIVYGTWQVKEYMVHNEDDDAVVLAAAGCKGKLLEGKGEIVREENVGGCNDDDCDDSSKIYYRVPIDCVQTKSGGEVTVSIDATDVQGNNMSGQYKLNVR